MVRLSGRYFSFFGSKNFAKAFDVTFADKEGKKIMFGQLPGEFLTRLMGALIMTHSDDKGLILPPKLAPIQVVIVPIYKVKNSFKKFLILPFRIKKRAS